MSSSLTTIGGALRLRNGALVLSGPSGPCCCDQCEYVVGISVIDEDSENLNRDANWAAFRAAWPERLFFLLQPRPTSDLLTIPAGWDGNGPIIVGRPGDVPPGAVTDWYAVCDLDGNLSVGGKISLFIDNSGSMETVTVQQSYDLFLSRLAARVIDGKPDPITIANQRLIIVEDFSEDWISPHISFDGCP